MQEQSMIFQGIDSFFQSSNSEKRLDNIFKQQMPDIFHDESSFCNDQRGFIIKNQVSRISKYAKYFVLRFFQAKIRSTPISQTSKLIIQSVSKKRNLDSLPKSWLVLAQEGELSQIQKIFKELGRSIKQNSHLNNNPIKKAISEQIKRLVSCLIQQTFEQAFDQCWGETSQAKKRQKSLKELKRFKKRYYYERQNIIKKNQRKKGKHQTREAKDKTDKVK